MTRILLDYHHACLFESHQLTFGDRFGWDVFAPYGREWYDEWIWSFERAYHGDAVALQYLEGIFAGGTLEDGIMTVADRKHPGRFIKGITLERARSEKWDFIVSSVPDNAAGFHKLAQETGASWGIHVGNQWGDEQWNRTPEFAILTTTSPVPGGIPSVTIHQEFSLRDFRPEEPIGFGPVSSFVNCFPETPEYPRFHTYADAAPDFDWRVYGAYGTAPYDSFSAGNCDTDVIEGNAMREAGAIWHAKYWSDGFGHVVHRAFAVGRPVFGSASYYVGKLAEPLWVDGVTSIDIDKRSPDEVASELRSLRGDHDRYLRMCENAARRFREVVSFDEDADKLAALFGVKVAA